MRSAVKVWTHRSTVANRIRFLKAKWLDRRCPHICRCCKYLRECREVGYKDWGVS